MFDVIGINDYTYGRGRYSILIKRPNSKFNDDGILYVKGEESSML